VPQPASPSASRRSTQTLGVAGTQFVHRPGWAVRLRGRRTAVLSRHGHVHRSAWATRLRGQRTSSLARRPRGRQSNGLRARPLRRYCTGLTAQATAAVHRSGCRAGFRACTRAHGSSTLASMRIAVAFHWRSMRSAVRPGLARTLATPNPSIERTPCPPLRAGQAAAHVKR